MAAKDKSFYSKNTLNLNGNILDLSIPRVMGILNITPDSFFSGSRHQKTASILDAAEKMIAEGVDIIDIGGFSSRPGARDISPEEEIDRVLKALKSLTKEFPEVPISVDTFRASVARQSIDYGAAMINDISGGTLDDNMFETISALGVPYVLMHMRGRPENMQMDTEYVNVVDEVFNFLQKKLQILSQMGVNDVIVDVGFGFSKTTDQNYVLLKNLNYFKKLETPILVGLSRKWMIRKSLECTPDEALNGTTALHTWAILQGADLLRVHDVKEAVEVIKIINSNKTRGITV